LKDQRLYMSKFFMESSTVRASFYELPGKTIFLARVMVGIPIDLSASEEALQEVREVLNEVVKRLPLLKTEEVASYLEDPFNN